MDRGRIQQFGTFYLCISDTLPTTVTTRARIRSSSRPHCNPHCSQATINTKTTPTLTEKYNRSPKTTNTLRLRPHCTYLPYYVLQGNDYDDCRRVQTRFDCGRFPFNSTLRTYKTNYTNTTTTLANNYIHALIAAAFNSTSPTITLSTICARPLTDTFSH